MRLPVELSRCAPLALVLAFAASSPALLAQSLPATVESNQISAARRGNPLQKLAEREVAAAEKRVAQVRVERVHHRHADGDQQGRGGGCAERDARGHRAERSPRGVFRHTGPAGSFRGGLHPHGPGQAE